MEDNKITIKQVRVEKHLEFHLSTKGTINYNDMLTFEYEGKQYYFRPTEVVINSEGTTAIVKERGYWLRRLKENKNVNYKDLIGMELFVETDKETIKKIDIESTYC